MAVPETKPATVGDRLRATRKSQGANQGDYAASIGASLRAYHAYEKDERLPPTELLIALSAKGVSIDWLLTGLGEMRRPQGLTVQRVGGSLRAGTLDAKGAFKVLPDFVSGDDWAQLRDETNALLQRLVKPGMAASMAGVDADLGHRLASIHLQQLDRPEPVEEDSTGQAAALIIMLGEAYQTAGLKISSADVARIGAEEYQAVYDGGETFPERKAAMRAVRARHIRAAAWAKSALVDPASRK